ncbi:WXG100 family type VII secretion target [[Mycobacterium] wendilense]|uniref:ESAT-6-like protein n=1 Tax=[Mycobacterium] wendilense TaxID=3064284 RepID=A0ABN9P496_9MYCO|nr:WXG100 family type VII secretion target [Mycolicibacterium sp. MU0050]CAJ1585154.1 WXG100 family type VII secretion target [Mycolicibacterium sp. MU0050]
MDPMLSYRFGEIDALVRQEIHTTAARLNTVLDDLKAQIAPLQELWTREAATAYRGEQLRWHQAAIALNEMLIRLGHAVADGATDLAETDRHAANTWYR